MSVQSGQIKCLKEKYGFLRMDDGTDVFFLPMSLDHEGGILFEDLHEGQRVVAEIEEGDRGLRVKGKTLLVTKA